MDETSDQSNQSVSIDRRDLLKKGAIGGSAAAFGVAGFSGTSLAGCTGGHFTEVVFCGCSQVCVCGDGRLEVLVAYEEEDGFSYDWVGGFSDNFCYEVDEGKIIAVKGGSGEEIATNPNDSCAGAALAQASHLLNCDDSDVDCEVGQSGGPCGDAFLQTCDG